MQDVLPLRPKRIERIAEGAEAMSVKRGERRGRRETPGTPGRGGMEAAPPASGGEVARQEMMADRHFMGVVQEIEETDARGELPPPKPWSVIEAKIEARRKAEQRRAV